MFALACCDTATWKSLSTKLIYFVGLLLREKAHRYLSVFLLYHTHDIDKSHLEQFIWPERVELK